ncbi:MAG: single-stranded-DNA-specific exonuclease RecJ [Candidatus Moraniibacteriota bacterium]|nr:MAG: single-stranded-DNA-specific exonuclease RecJ [Candidatus Moranbacteria bacterium]
MIDRSVVMKRVWRERSGFKCFAAPTGPSSIAGHLLKQRGINREEEVRQFMFPEYERDLHDPFLFRDMEKVVGRIAAAQDRGEKIGVFGDFDADGVTSSVIIRETLERLGIDTVIHIPHKIDEGHGLSRKAILRFRESGVRLILTLDCGMMNHQEIAEAASSGMETIVIDHHHVPEILPPAFAIINPKLPADTYPFRDLCGAGTSFKVATALYRRLMPERTEELKWLLDVAAIGTVADVMPLIGENRVIVKYGLIVLQKTRRPGLLEMYAVGRIPIDDRHAPDARMIAFQIAPRINAASRMAHAETAHELLFTLDRVKARVLALELEGYNSARQKVSQVAAENVRAVAELKFRDEKFIVAVGSEFPLGVVGLVAGKVAHEIGKPTGVFQRGEEMSTGSFRSIPGFSIIEALEECSDLFEKFGGHEQAAGLTIRNDRMDAFLERFGEIVRDRLKEVETVPELLIDAELHPGDVTLDLIRALSDLAPFGEGNPEPVFRLSGLEIREARTVGKGGKHWKLSLSHSSFSHSIDAVGWSLVTSYPDLGPGCQIEIVCQIEENTWNGRTVPQLKLLDMKR